MSVISDKANILLTNEDFAELMNENALKERLKVLEELLKVAKCPANCTDGVIAYQISDDDWEPQQCQWCFERNGVLEDK